MLVLSVYRWLKTGSCWFLHQKCVTTFWKSVNKVCIWILNYQPEHKFKTELFHWKRNWDMINCKNIILKSVGGKRKKFPHTFYRPLSAISWRNFFTGDFCDHSCLVSMGIVVNSNLNWHTKWVIKSWLIVSLKPNQIRQVYFLSNETFHSP